jgi:hypothetical protein
MTSKHALDISPTGQLCEVVAYQVASGRDRRASEAVPDAFGSLEPVPDGGGATASGLGVATPVRSLILLANSTSHLHRLRRERCEGRSPSFGEGSVS